MDKKSKNNKDKFNPIKNIGSNVVIWILIIGMSITALQIFSSDNNYHEISIRDFNEHLNAGRIESGTVTGTSLDTPYIFKGKLKSSARSTTSQEPSLFITTNLIDISDAVQNHGNILVKESKTGFFDYLIHFCKQLISDLDLLA